MGFHVSLGEYILLVLAAKPGAYGPKPVKAPPCRKMVVVKHLVFLVAQIRKNQMGKRMNKEMEPGIM